jgi:hypothetical protein
MGERGTWFWCTTCRKPHEDAGVMFADGAVHKLHCLNGCTLVGPYFTEVEAVEWAASIRSGRPQREGR